MVQFDDLVRSGIITPQTLVWREGLVNWQPFGLITATPSALPSSLPTPPPPGGVPPVIPGPLTTCIECGNAFAQSEMICYGDAWICARCKPFFFQRIREGAPLAAVGAEAWQSGDAVVALHGGTLPARCVRCNGAVTGKPINRTFYWHPNWVLVLLLIPLIYLIVYPIVAKRARVSVPICEECRQRRRVCISVSWLLVAIGLGTVIASSVIDSEALGILTLVPWLAAIFLGFYKGMLVSTKKVDAQYVWIRGCCKEYRASLPEFPELR